MAIEVKIPKEITEYREKLMFGLSIRQLICLALAILICGATFFLLTCVITLNDELVGYVIMVEAAPLLAVGFVRKNGFTFEKYAALFLRHKLGTLTRPYKTELMINRLGVQDKKESSLGWITQKDEGPALAASASRQERRRDAARKECEIFTVTKQLQKERDKAVRLRIKAALEPQKQHPLPRSVTQNNTLQKEINGVEKYDWIFDQEERTGDGSRECSIFIPDKKLRKRQQKQISRKISAARAEYRAAKQRYPKSRKKGGRAENLAADHKIPENV